MVHVRAGVPGYVYGVVYKGMYTSLHRFYSVSLLHLVLRPLFSVLRFISDEDVSLNLRLILSGVKHVSSTIPHVLLFPVYAGGSL